MIRFFLCFILLSGPGNSRCGKMVSDVCGAGISYFPKFLLYFENRIFNQVNKPDALHHILYYWSYINWLFIV